MSANHILQNFLSAQNFPEWTFVVSQRSEAGEHFTE